VHPEAVNKAVLKCIKKYPSKRFLIHYIQPHHPFIGDIKIREVGALARDDVLGYKKPKNKTVWELAYDGKVNLDLIQRAYISNLKFVLKHVDKLLSCLKGKKCITSDHGNTFGRFGLYYGHPDIPFPEIIEVPWLDVEI
jgi:hypothetical protein